MLLSLPSKNVLSLITYALLGILLGIWSFFSLGTLYLFLIAGAIVCYLHAKLPAEERNFVLILFSIAFLLKAILSVAYYYYFIASGGIPVFAYDGEQYSGRAYYISVILKGENIFNHSNVNLYGMPIRNFINMYDAQIPAINEYQVGPYTYLLSLIYTFFGYAPVLIRMLNGLFGILSAVVAYFIAKEIFNLRVARATFAVTLFLPSIFLHSISALKDPLLNFSLILLIFALVKLFGKTSWKKYVFIGIIALLLTSLLRNKTVGFVLASTVLSGYILALKQKKTRISAILIALILCIGFAAQYNKLVPMLTKIKNTAIKAHIGYVNTPGKVYKILPDRFYADPDSVGEIQGIQLNTFIAQGLAHAMFEPFIGSYTYTPQAKIIYIAQMSLWYLLVPFFIYGLLLLGRLHAGGIIPVLIFFFIILLTLAITIGNPGTIFRMRDMIAPLYLMLAFYGIDSLLYSSKKNSS